MNPHRVYPYRTKHVPHALAQVLLTLIRTAAITFFFCLQAQAQTAPEIVFDTRLRNVTGTATFQTQIGDGSDSWSSTSSQSNWTTNKSLSWSVSNGTGSFTSNDAQTRTTGTYGRQSLSGYRIFAYAKNPGDMTVSGSVSGNVSLTGTGSVFQSQHTAPLGMDAVTVTKSTSGGPVTLNDSGSDSVTQNVALTCASSYKTFSQYPGVKYYEVVGSQYFGAYTRMEGSGNASTTASGTVSVTVTKATDTPVAQIVGPKVGGVVVSNPSVGQTVVVQSDSYDPGNGSSGNAGICSYAWTITNEYGDTPLTFSNSAPSFVVSRTGKYTAQLSVTDNEGDTSQSTLDFTVGPRRNACPGQGNECRDEANCIICKDDKTNICGSASSGNIAALWFDPVPTRGHPLANRIAVNSQQSIAAYLPRDTWMGNAVFTYGIQVLQGLKYISGSSALRWIVLDGNGSEIDFGAATSSPTATAGVYSLLVQTSSGYELQDAGAPGELWQAGNYNYVFDSGGRLLSIEDPQGNIQEITYNSSLDPVQVEDLSSLKTITFEYDTPGVIARVVENGSGAVTHLTYSSGLLTNIDLKTSAGVTVRSVSYTYDSFGLLSSMTRDGDSATQMSVSYKDAGFGVKVGNITAPNGGGTRFQYFETPGTGASHRTSKTNAQNQKTYFDYDSLGQLTKETRPIPNGATAAPTFTYGYDTNGNLSSWSDSAVSYSYSYNPKGLVSQWVEASGITWNYSYNGVDLTEISNTVGTILTVGYTDSANPHSPTTFTDGAGNVSSRTYNAYGQVLTEVPPTGSPSGTTTYQYEENSSSPMYGYLKQITNGAGEITTFDSYSPLGDVTSISTYPSTGVTNTTTYEYDAAQRLTKITRPDGKTIENVYTGAGLTSTADEAASVTDYEYCPSCGRMTAVDMPLSKRLEWSLNSSSQVAAFIDGRTKSTSYTYGNMGELKRVDYPDSTYYTLTYDNRAREKVHTNARGNTATKFYNSTGRVSAVQYASPTATQSTITYTADGKIATVSDQVGSYTYSYTTNRLLQKVEYDLTQNSIQVQGRVEYTYNPDETVSTMKWIRGTGSGTLVAEWDYDYDGAGRLTEVTNSFGETTSYSYDDEGKLQTQSNQNGTTLEYTYNESRDWPSRLEYALSGTPFARYDIEYDATSDTVGNISKVTELSGDTVEYGYDALYRLTEEERTGTNAYTTSYGYDPAGNITELNGSSFGSFDDANKLTSLSGGSIGYDADGNTSSLTYGPIGPSTFSFEHRSKLSSETVGATTYSYKYNTFGLRGARTSPGTRFYIFNGEELLGELDGQNPDVAYTWGADGLVSRRTLQGTAASRWYHFGPQGESRQLTDSAGSVTDTYLYNGYGKVVATSGSSFNPYRYGGKYGYYSDGLSKLMLATHRWYSAELMRWMTRDPIEYEGGDNLYGYVLGRPVKFVDPEGLAYVLNLSNRALLYKPENEGGIRRSCGKWELCDVDGIYPESSCANTMPIKIPGNCIGVINRDGEIRVRCIFPSIRSPFQVDDSFLDEHRDWLRP